jgi:hypothetical protein
VTDRWFSPGPPVSSTNKTDHHDITEIFVESGVKHHKAHAITMVPLYLDRMLSNYIFILRKKTISSICLNEIPDIPPFFTGTLIVMGVLLQNKSMILVQSQFKHLFYHIAIRNFHSLLLWPVMVKVQSSS